MKVHSSVSWRPGVKGRGWSPKCPQDQLFQKSSIHRASRDKRLAGIGEHGFAKENSGNGLRINRPHQYASDLIAL